eukprot:scaffold301657_cov19-Prasinocladus_malaysianus.AAC.1
MQELAPADAGGYTGALPLSGLPAHCDAFSEACCPMYKQSWVNQSHQMRGALFACQLVRGATTTQSLARVFINTPFQSLKLYFGQ